MGYRLAKEKRVIAMLARKILAYDWMTLKERYPKGRLLHLAKQIRRLQYYVDAHAL